MEESSFDPKAIFESFASSSRPKERECDYRDETGLLVCGVCGERREQVKVIGDGDKAFSLVFGRECACMKAERESKELAEKIYKEKMLVTKLRRASLMDKRLSESRFANAAVIAQNEKAFKMAKRYVAKWNEVYNANQGLMFHGRAGSGKTFLAACIANELLDKGISVMMTSCTRIADMVLHSEESEQEILRKVNSARLLILDDLGSERNTDYSTERIYNIIDARYRACKPLIVTTNLTLEAMASEEDVTRGRIYSRIKEMCFPVEVNGIEWRGYAANEHKKFMSELMGDE